jgi:serine/threonine protein kinase
VGFDPLFDLPEQNYLRLVALKGFVERLKLNPIYQGTDWNGQLIMCKESILHPGLGELLISHTENIVIKRTAINSNFLLELDIVRNQQLDKNDKFLTLGVHYFLYGLFGCSLYELKTIKVDLGTYIKRKRISNSQMHFIVLQIVRALEYLHLNQIIHGAVAPENILINSSKVTLANFSFASTDKRVQFSPRFTKFPFNGPDIFASTLTDLWGVGIVFSCLLFRHHLSPFQNVLETAPISYDVQQDLFSPSKLSEIIVGLNCSEQHENFLLITLRCISPMPLNAKNVKTHSIFFDCYKLV